MTYARICSDVNPLGLEHPYHPDCTDVQAAYRHTERRRTIERAHLHELVVLVESDRLGRPGHGDVVRVDHHVLLQNFAPATGS